MHFLDACDNQFKEASDKNYGGTRSSASTFFLESCALRISLPFIQKYFHAWVARKQLCLWYKSRGSMKDDLRAFLE